MHISDFDYDLPPELIAQEPLADRDRCRLLWVSRRTGAVMHVTLRTSRQVVGQRQVKDWQG